MKQEYAFPSPVDPKTGTNQLGITVRDYFAAKAMQALIDSGFKSKNVCEEAFILADGMMEARK